MKRNALEWSLAPNHPQASTGAIDLARRWPWQPSIPRIFGRTTNPGVAFHDASGKMRRKSRTLDDLIGYSLRK